MEESVPTIRSKIGRIVYFLIFSFSIFLNSFVYNKSCGRNMDPYSQAGRLTGAIIINVIFIYIILKFFSGYLITRRNTKIIIISVLYLLLSASLLSTINYESKSCDDYMEAVEQKIYYFANANISGEPIEKQVITREEYGDFVDFVEYFQDLYIEQQEIVFEYIHNTNELTIQDYMQEINNNNLIILEKRRSQIAVDKEAVSNYIEKEKILIDRVEKEITKIYIPDYYKQYFMEAFKENFNYLNVKSVETIQLLKDILINVEKLYDIILDNSDQYEYIDGERFFYNDDIVDQYNEQIELFNQNVEKYNKYLNEVQQKIQKDLKDFEKLIN